MGRVVVRLVLSTLLLIVQAPLLLAGAACAQPGFRGSLLQKKATLADRPLSRGRRLSEPTSIHIKATGLYYVMELAVGTPPVTVHATVASSDLCWVECSPCSGCSTPARARLYDRGNSSSSSPLSCTSQACKILPREARTNCNETQCGYRYVYGATDTDYNYVQGILGTDTFKFGSNDEVTTQNFVFGCTDRIYRNDLFDGNTGVVGLGRTNLSLVGQLGLDRFSYCLSSNPKAASPILFGSTAQLAGSGVLLSTPLLDHYMDYSVNLLGISVNGTRLRIPNNTFALDPKTGQGGFSFETSAPAMLLVDPAYTVVVEAFKARMSKTYRVFNESSLLCFLVDASNGDVTVPTMTMHFDGMDMELRTKNYFAFGKLESGGDGMCLMVGKSRTTSVIGSIMQMDFHVLFDLKNSMVSVQPADCSKV